ncbi:hypothetical protein [Nodosilinea sp. LEGE 07088]|nr:hypothetical protein [Nodosilinea sp. LEGE 07088]
MLRHASAIAHRTLAVGYWLTPNGLLAWPNRLTAAWSEGSKTAIEP